MSINHYQVKDKNGWKLASHDPGDTSLCADKQKALAQLEKLKAELAELQFKMYAGNEFGLLVVLQAPDGGGKDGTIRNVLSGVNPQGVHVSSFKAPSGEEANHDYLWRIHKSAPARGRFVVFNRSHYEDVLIARVHGDLILPEWAKKRPNLWVERYEQINNFEKHLTQNNIVIVKCFLNISKDEQKKRFEKRLSDPTRNWKFSPNDMAERKFWEQYQGAYEQMLHNTNTPWAPWYVVPGNNKWHRSLVVAEILVQTLRALKLEFPKADPEALKRIVLE